MMITNNYRRSRYLYMESTV